MNIVRISSSSPLFLLHICRAYVTVLSFHILFRTNTRTHTQPLTQAHSCQLSTLLFNKVNRRMTISNQRLNNTSFVVFERRNHIFDKQQASSARLRSGICYRHQSLFTGRWYRIYHKINEIRIEIIVQTVDCLRQTVCVCELLVCNCDWIKRQPPTTTTSFVCFDL